MWINEAFAHYFAFLPVWKFIDSKESNMNAYNCRDLQYIYNCTCFKTIDENFAFSKRMTFIAQMHDIQKQGPLYQKGRAWRDTIGYVYEWGAMFVRMVEATIGRSQFQVAMQRYMKRNRFSNIDHEKLWSELEFVNPFKKEKITLSTIFNSWIYQKGVPFLRVSRSNVSGSESILRLHQVHYSGPDGNSNALSSSVWYIPINFIVIHKRNGKYERTPNESFIHQYVMKNTSDTVSMNIPGEAKLDKYPVAILNVNFTGTYHVGYDEDEWKRIGRVLMENTSLIPWFDRRQLVFSLENSLRRNEIKPYLILCIGEYIQVSKIFQIF